MAEKAKEPTPGWVWLFTGAVLGAFIMFLIGLSEVRKYPEGTNITASRATVAENPARNTSPKFTFYDMLRETKVSVPSASTAQERAVPVIANDMEYIVQVASFRKQSDADQVRAKLILLNLNATVEPARVRNGERWYRVLVGPFDSRSMVSSARSTLLANNHEALILKRSKY
ncbi:MAG: SPOR domain-containing protein [Cellvibrionaceae bacterium]|nr:SPOR domain-containing protein [Cellvibrionaceae bacterium]